MSSQPIANPHIVGHYEKPFSEVESSTSALEATATKSMQVNESERSQFGILMILMVSFVAGILMASRA